MMDDIVKLNVMESSSTLFEKPIQVRVTKSPGFEDRLMELTVRIVMGISKLHRSSKLLRMQLTNEADPFFLYFLEVSEDDFQNLKVEQCILVDFTTFPYKLIELLEQCIKDAGSHDTPRFQAILHVRTGDSTFSVVEANQFKHLSHLSLCFRQGNDSTIKTYLAGSLAEFKSANMDLHEKLRRTLMSLEMALRDNGNLSSELSELRENNSRAMNQLKGEYSLELAHEKEKAIQEIADAKEKFEKERSHLESHLRHQAEAHQERLLELEKQVRTLLESKHTLEVKIAEVSTRLTNSGKELDERNQESERLRIENQNLDCERQVALKNLNQHLVRLGALEQEVQDKSELITSLQKQLATQTLQRSSLEIAFKDAQLAADRAEERSKFNEMELNKCQQSIEKLQAELRTCKAKVKLKGQMASQQDNLLVERQTSIDRTMQENSNLKQEITVMKDDNESMRKKVEELQSKLDESQELQQSNQQMIQWLNQQLTDAQIAKLGATSVSSRYMLRPTNLSSFLPSSTDSMGRATSNHVGPPAFSASASLNNGPTSGSSTYKNLDRLRSSSPFCQQKIFHSKAVGSNANSSLIPPIIRPRTSSPLRGISGSVQKSTDLHHTTNLEFPTMNNTANHSKPGLVLGHVEYMNSTSASARENLESMNNKSGSVLVNLESMNKAESVLDNLESMNSKSGSGFANMESNNSKPGSGFANMEFNNSKSGSLIENLGSIIKSDKRSAAPLSGPEDEGSWTLLPRPPPLSFVEARSELHKWTGKYSTSTDNEKKGLNNGAAHKVCNNNNNNLTAKGSANQLEKFTSNI